MQISVNKEASYLVGQGIHSWASQMDVCPDQGVCILVRYRTRGAFLRPCPLPVYMSHACCFLNQKIQTVRLVP